MAVEYDLVVIGGSSAGVYAAVAANFLKARVALVDQGSLEADGFGQLLGYQQTLAHVGRVSEQIRQADLLGFQWQTPEGIAAKDIRLRWEQVHQWATGVFNALNEQPSASVLAALGVEVVVGCGQFCRRPRLGFAVGDRVLRSRAYLIATGSCPIVPEIEGLQTTGFLSADTLGQTASQPTPPQQVVMIGGDPTGTELAQTFARLGSKVTMVMSSPHLLAKEDPEAARLIQAQLEAEGVRVLTQTQVTQVRKIQGQKWVQAGNEAIAADEIFLAAGRQPNVHNLNLEAVGVRWTTQGIERNAKLQTTNPRIYACGSAIAGYPYAHIAQYEASVALRNALFFPIFRLKEAGIPWAIFSEPQLARVGLTEPQAFRRYGKDVMVLRQYLKTLAQAHLQDQTTGFCKVIVRRNGTILGAHIVGPQASEIIQAIALAMRHQLKIGAIADLPFVSPTWSEILVKTAELWHQQRLQQNPGRQNFLEGFFAFRRSWSS